MNFSMILMVIANIILKFDLHNVHQLNTYFRNDSTVLGG